MFQISVSFMLLCFMFRSKCMNRFMLNHQRRAVIKGELTQSCTVSSMDVVIIMVCLHSNIRDLLLSLFTVHNVLKVM